MIDPRSACAAALAFRVVPALPDTRHRYLPIRREYECISYQMVFWDDRVSGMALGYLVCTWHGIGSSSQVLEVVFLAHAPRITAWRALNTHDFYKIPKFIWLFMR